MDGGLASPTNADLATGYGRIVIVAPTLGQRDAVGLLFATMIRREQAKLRQVGAQVTVLAPDKASLAAFGPDLGNSRLRQAAARAGEAQGYAERLAL